MKTSMAFRLGWCLLGAAPILLVVAACATVVRERAVYSQAQPPSHGTDFVTAAARYSAGASIKFKPFDFSPRRGSRTFDIGESGAARGPLRWVDAKLYVPSVSLTSPAPAEVTLCFWVKDDVSMGWDTTLGVFCVTIRKGATAPHRHDIKAFTSAGQTHRGASAFHYGSFWLVCTRRGRVRGSENEEGGSGDVYIESFGQLFTGGAAVDWRVSAPQSPRHRVRCL